MSTSGLTLAVWVANPYAAALLLPAAHLWLLAGMSQRRLRGPAAWAAVAGGLLGLGLAGLHEMLALDLGPAALARTWLIATAGGHVSLLSALAAGLLIACLATLVLVVHARAGIRPGTPVAGERRPRTRGPAGYAGPGSLGGTESALRR